MSRRRKRSAARRAEAQARPAPATIPDRPGQTPPARLKASPSPADLLNAAPSPAPAGRDNAGPPPAGRGNAGPPPAGHLNAGLSPAGPVASIPSRPDSAGPNTAGPGPAGPDTAGRDAADPATAGPAPAPSRPFEPRSIACAAADTVFAPALLCDRARCRRHRRCSLPGTTEPDLKEGVAPPVTMYPRCLLTAPIEVIQEFHTILGVAMHLEKRLVPGLLRLLTDTSEDSPFRAHDNAIYATLQSCLPRGDPLKAEFQDFWRREAARGEP